MQQHERVLLHNLFLLRWTQTRWRARRAVVRPRGPRRAVPRRRVQLVPLRAGHEVWGRGVQLDGTHGGGVAEG